MLIRLGPADSVPAGQRVVRAFAVPTDAGHGTASFAHKRALPGSQRHHAAEPAPGRTTPASGFDCREATWSAPDSGDATVQQAIRFSAQYIREAYRATDPVQPRPGLYLHVQA